MTDRLNAAALDAVVERLRGIEEENEELRAKIKRLRAARGWRLLWEHDGEQCRCPNCAALKALEGKR